SKPGSAAKARADALLAWWNKKISHPMLLCCDPPDDGQLQGHACSPSYVVSRNAFFGPFFLVQQRANILRKLKYGLPRMRLLAAWPRPGDGLHVSTRSPPLDENRARSLPGGNLRRGLSQDREKGQCVLRVLSPQLARQALRSFEIDLPQIRGQCGPFTRSIGI
ncbi:hypothetical protein B0H10DRAFT_1967382, partial [Mycena sp. CBHHK59/15]